MKRTLLLMIPALFLMSCVTTDLTSELSTKLTNENLMKIHQGMDSSEVLSLFGEPKNISVNVCGMPPNQWTCTDWEYGDYPFDGASFTFSGEHDAMKLNNFDINRD